MSRRRIPVWVHVPWFMLALAGMVVWYGDDAGLRTWTWEPGVSLPFRFSVFALAMWSLCSRWMLDVSLRRADRPLPHPAAQ